MSPIERPSNVSVFAIKDHDEKKLHLYWEQYLKSKSVLENKFPDYYVVTLRVYRDSKAKIVTLSSWANFIPNIFPESDYVLFSLFDFDTNPYKIKGPVTVYVIEQEKLFSILGEYVKKITSPVLCFVAERVEDVILKKKILDQSKLVTEEIFNPSNEEKIAN